MIRPMLSLLCARACSDGPLGDESHRVAAASELLHNATLLHDDVADEGTCRRGVPTVAAELGNAASVLVGDFCLVKAMNTIVSLKERRDRYVNVFSKTLLDLAEGEIFQLQKAQTGDTSQEDYFRIIYCKTASLFEASCVGGALSVSAPELMEQAVRRYGERLGLAFQVRDDILDYVGSEHLGKPAGSDLKEQKITLPLLGALLKVDDGKQRMVRQMVCDIHSHPDNCERILDFVQSYDGVAFAQAKLQALVDEAVQALSDIRDSEAKRALMELARFTASRDS